MPRLPETPPVVQPRADGAPPSVGGIIDVLKANIDPRPPKPERHKKKVDVKAEKEKAEGVIAKLKQGIFPKADTPKTPEIEERILREQLARGNTQGFIKKVEDIPDDPKMLDALTDILTAPAELQNDPRWLFAKGAEIRNALRADMPDDQQRAARAILKNIYQKIVVIEGINMSDPQVRISKNLVVQEKVQFVELAGNSLLPEAGVLPTPAAPVPPSAVENIYRDTGDSLAGSFLAGELKKIKFRLITDTNTALHDTHKLARFQQEIEDAAVKRGGFDSPDVQREVREAKRRIQAVIDETLAAQRLAESARHADRFPSTPAFEGEEKWIYLSKTDDQIALETADVPELDKNGKPTGNIRNRQVLREALQSVGGKWNAESDTQLNEALRVLHEPVLKGQLEQRDIAPYVNKIKEYIRLYRKNRWNIIPYELDKIAAGDWQLRDKIFYELIENVIKSGFETSREVRNLYADVAVDNFINAMRTNLGPGVGDEVAQRYLLIKSSIFFFHDLELMARNAGGDVELFMKFVHSAQGQFYTEFLADPVFVDMMSSYEQAIRKFYHDNDGYLPPFLFKSDRGGPSPLDKQAMQFFRAKVNARAVRDYKLDEHFLGKLRGDNIGYEFGAEFTLHNLEDQKGRIEAFQHVAKGAMVFNHRLLELTAKAKAPGFETTESAFSSIPFEGLARAARPWAHLINKYKMGEVSYKEAMGIIFGQNLSTFENFIKFSDKDWQEVFDAVQNGTFNKWVLDKYGEKKGAEILKQAVPFIKVSGDFIWTGRQGPHSQWGQNDATLYWDDLKREKEGGSIRLGRAKWWAERYLKAHIPNWEDTKTPDGKIIKGIQHTLEGKTKLEQLMRAYKTWVWVQLIQRSPLTVAENVFMTTDGRNNGKGDAWTLRRHLINKILKFDTKEKIATEATPNDEQLRYMKRVGVLEADIAAVQRVALFGGPNGEPRDIRDEDFQCIRDDPKEPVVDPKTGQPIDVEARREQARMFFAGVKEHMLATDMQKSSDWERVLGISPESKTYVTKGDSRQYDNMLHFSNWESIDNDVDRGIDNILKNNNRGKLLQPSIIDPSQDIYMGMDDVHKGELDLQNLGERAYARLTNDFLNRWQAVNVMPKLLAGLRPKMNQKEYFEDLRKMYEAERAGRGPDNSAKAFYYHFARVGGEYYRGTKWASAPVLGKILGRFYPTSIAKRAWTPEFGESWSINNMRNYIHDLANQGILPVPERNPDGTINEYSIERLERELVATPYWAISEMIVIGSVILAITTMLTAATKQIEEEKE